MVAKSFSSSPNTLYHNPSNGQALLNLIYLYGSSVPSRALHPRDTKLANSLKSIAGAEKFRYVELLDTYSLCH